MTEDKSLDYYIEKCGLPPDAKRLDFAPYAVTKNGNVFNLARGKWLKSCDNGLGYLQVWLVCDDGTKRWFKVHRLVAECFVPNLKLSKGANEVNHKNGKKGDNRACNLEWCTHSENVQHSFSVLERSRGKSAMEGRKHSEEAKKKMSEAKLGKNHPRYKGYVYEGRVFDSLRELAEYMGTYQVKVDRMVKKGLIETLN